MTDRDYAIKSMKEITFQMANHAQDYLEVTIERHYTDIKELMTSYQKLILKTRLHWKNWIGSARRKSMKIWHMH